MTTIWAPKRPCPRNLGVWYCVACQEKHHNEEYLADYAIAWQGCGKYSGGKICGVTHLGFEWCDECKAAGRTPNPHFGEFEAVAEIRPA